MKWPVVRGNVLCAATAIFAAVAGLLSGIYLVEHSPHRLVEAFRGQRYFWDQFEAGKALALSRDRKLLPELEDLLASEDRHVRGNTAFVFASMGDSRGFETLVKILGDREQGSDAQASAGGHVDEDLRRRVAQDRYYAAHLLGDLKDPRAVPLLIPLLNDHEIREIIPWALSNIGDSRAVQPLITTLQDPDPSMRVLAILGLQGLRAKESLPAIRALRSDTAKSNFDKMITVGEAAETAVARIESD